MSRHPPKVLIVDDEPNMLHMLDAVLTEEGYETNGALNGIEAIKAVESGHFDFILSDVRMPGMDGLTLLQKLREKDIDSIVILMSAYGSIDLALEAIRKGAYDYISKPFKTDEVVLTFRKAAERERLRREVVSLKRRLGRYEEPPRMVVKSPAMKAVLEVARQAAPFDSSILITGESGTGKEVTAREIHRLSKRNGGPFTAINCGAIPEHLLESELFGFRRGSFTGADSDKQGLFEESHEGTLFLDEIAAMPLNLQIKILRTLDSGEVRRLGETAVRRFSVRVIAATNEDVEFAVQQKRFRHDLYYRLNVVRLHLPPLRERREEILPLVQHFVQGFNSLMGLKITSLAKDTENALLKGRWKGNVRELRNVIERAMILCAGDTITPACLPAELTGAACELSCYPEKNNENLSLKRAYRELESSYIVRALNKTGGNRTQAASLLEISYPSLLQKIKDLGLS